MTFIQLIIACINVRAYSLKDSHYTSQVAKCMYWKLIIHARPTNWWHAKLIHYDSLFSTLHVTYYMKSKDLTACNSSASSQVTSKLEMWSTFMLIFQISRTCLVPSLSRTSYLKEPLIGTPSFRLEAMLCMAIVICLLFLQGGSTSLCPRDRPFLSCSVRQIHIFYISRGEPVSFMLHEVNLHLLCFARRITAWRCCLFGFLLYRSWFPLEVPFNPRSWFPPQNSRSPVSLSLVTFPHAIICWLEEPTLGASLR